MNESVTSDNGYGTGSKFREPYRATKLWLEAVAIFRRGVPLGKHRRQWRSYDNCFQAQEAITWFQSQLQIAFDPSITRKQTLTLLQKFYKANIIIDASKPTQGLGNSSPAVTNETDFKDNCRLFKLVCQDSGTTTSTRNTKTLETSKIASKSEATLKSQMPKSTSKYDVLIKPLSSEEIYKIWEQSFINKFVQIVGCDVFTSFFVPGLINGYNVSYNLTQLGPHNIVVSAEKSDDLPHWLVSAMKCLANWPNSHTQENGIPNYPGFENDVYKLISDYFMSFKNKSPLLTYGLYDAFITTFIRAELFDFNSRLYSAKISNAARSRIFQQMMMTPKEGGNFLPHFAPQSPMFKLEDQYPFNASESVENLIIDILTPANISGKNRSSSAAMNARKKLFNQKQTTTTSPVLEDVGQVSAVSTSSTMPRNLFSSLKDCREISANSAPHLGIGVRQNSISGSSSILPNPMPSQDYNVVRYTNPMFFETAFTGNSPITRVVSHTELKASLGSKTLNASRGKVRPPAASADAILDSSNYSHISNYAYENPFLELSASDLINHPKYSRILESSDLQSQINQSPTENLSSNSFWNYSNNSSGGSGYETGPSSTQSSATVSTAATQKAATTSFSMLDDKFMRKTTRAVSAINLSDAVRDRHPYTSLTGGVQRRIQHHGGQFTPGRSLASHYANSPSKSVRRMLEFYYGADACVPGLMTTEGKRLAILSFRLLTLLLPPVNRRHLQILLRFMSKTSRNDKLMLDVATSTRAIIINTFFRCVLRSEDIAEYDELLALRIVTFLMDNDHEIFLLEDNDIVTTAQAEISQQQVIKVPNDADTTSVPTTTAAATTTTTSSGSAAEEEKKIQTQPQDLNTKTMTMSNSNTKSNNDKIDDNEKGLDRSISDQYVYVEANKENNLQYCSRITMDEYEDQRLLSGTSLSLRQLLDTLVNNDKLGEKEKRKQILKFKDEYPHIFQEKFGDDEWPSFLLNDSTTKAKGKKEKKTWNLFKALRL